MKMKKETWMEILKILATVITAIAASLGIQSCVG